MTVLGELHLYCVVIHVQCTCTCTSCIDIFHSGGSLQVVLTKHSSECSLKCSSGISVRALREGDVLETASVELCGLVGGLLQELVEVNLCVP